MTKDAEQSLRDLVVNELDRMLLSVPKITDGEAWKVVKSRFDLMVERLEYFACTTDDEDNRTIFRNAITKLQTIEPRACHV